MAATQDEDMYLFQGGIGTPAYAGNDFDAFLETPAPDDISTMSVIDPNNLMIKRESESFSPSAHNDAFARVSRGSGSASSSSSDDPDHKRNLSAASTASPPAQDSANTAWGSGINGFSVSANDHVYEDVNVTGLDQDYETSNQEMAAAFDFETAASTPSGFDVTSNPNNAKNPFANYQGLTKPAAFGDLRKQRIVGPTGQPQFFFAGSRETSPLAAMLPSVQRQSPWTKPSPSSGLEETFNHINMDGDSPSNNSFSPNAQFTNAAFSFDPESSATPSSLAKEVSSPPSTINFAEGMPTLTVQPTSLKSRVETQIPIRLTLSFLPSGITKLRLPRHTVSKPKFLAKTEVVRSAEIFELHVSLVCTSAIQDKFKLQRALARARGETLGPYNRPSPAFSADSGSSGEDEEKPLNGGEVRICSGCIQRERKRASRKKMKKPEEEEIFRRDEDRRVVVFNTNEIKDWADISQETTNDDESNSQASVTVELPMRIACYCRHQNEKLGFQVIFTIKDHHDKVIAQALTNPIMITDDHKTHTNAPSAGANVPPPLPTSGPQLPGAGVFATMDQELSPHLQPQTNRLPSKAYSTTNLADLQHNFNPSFAKTPNNVPFAIPATPVGTTSSNMAPRNLSRPASPSGIAGPMTKRRKQSGSGKLPTGLTMTRLDTSQSAANLTSLPNTAASTPFASSINSFVAPTNPHFGIYQGPRATPYGNSPPTPNGTDPSFAANVNRSMSHDNMSRQVMISAPPSRQPSRPGSPGSARNSFGASDAAFGQAVNSQLLNHPARRPSPLIHKLVPAEGSVTGGTEVTLLGNGFYQGLEVMFGDTEATTTTFWGEKCLNCIAPPALQPGVVPVVFKHDHPQYTNMPPHTQTRPSLFTYVDDRELEMFRLALRTLGKTLPRPTDDPYSAAQALLQAQSHGSWQTHHSYGMGGGHQRGHNNFSSAAIDALELESMMLQLLDHLTNDALVQAPRLDLCRPSGLTLLHLSASLGLTRFVAALLTRGADPNTMDNNGFTPMHHAAMNGHTHVIHRLRLAGGNHNVRSVRHFVPADLATSLLAYQATTTAFGHYRSRSAGGTPMRLHSRSSSSLRSFWDNASGNYTSTNTDDSDESGEFDDDTPTRSSSEEPELSTTAGPTNTIPMSIPPSRRGSMKPNLNQRPGFTPSPSSDASAPAPPSAFMLAWRDHLVAQLQQFNESAHAVMPTLANLNAPLAALQDYQAYPMVRRVSALFPQRPNLRQQQAPAREGWWEALTGGSSPASSSPPAYGDLFPNGQEESEQDWAVKKFSTMQAAGESAADFHYEQQAASANSVASSSSKVETVSFRKPIERIELSRDRKLFFFWIPLLAIVLALMIRSSGLLEMFASSQTQTPITSKRIAMGVF